MVQNTYWSNLPSEILNIVFLYLKKSDKNVTQEKDLSPCALTCRGWKRASQVVLFSNVLFRSKNDVNNLCLLLLGNSSYLGMLIKTLSFEGTSLNNSTDITTLLAVNLQIPNLEALNFSGNNLLYSSFTKMIKNGNFKYLKQPPIPKNIQQDKLYLQCVDYLKDRIATIDLFHDEVNSTGALYTNFCKKLNRFPNLANAVIHISTSNDMNSQNFIKKIESILDSNLASLQQLLIISFENKYRYLCLRFLRGDSLCITIYNNSFRFLNLCDEIMALIMNQFSNLKRVYLERISDKNWKAAMPELSLTEVVLQFANYLSKIPKCNLGGIWLDTQDAIKIIKYICENSSKEDSKPIVVSEFLTMNEDRQLFYDLPSFDDRPLSIISFKNKQPPSTVRRMINFISLYDEEDYNNSNYQIQLNLIEETDSFVNLLRIQIFRNTNLDTLLNCVAIYCKQLINLDIFYLGNLPLSNSTRSEGEETIRTCCTIEALSLYNYIPTPGDFVCILKRLPSLIILSLKNCFTRNHWCGGERYFSICLPNVALALLEITMNEKLFDKCKSEAYYIKLVNDVESKIRYCRVTVEYTRYKNVVGYSVLKDVAESDFQESVVNSKMSSCLIYCKSVRHFSIKYIAAEDGQETMVNI